MRQRDILWFWLPLFASWMLMTAEGPIVSATINRLPNEVIMLAAQGIVISLSVFIESPIINMLATSTALVKDWQSYVVVRRFTIHWMVALTAVTLLIAFTPLFDLVVRRGMGAPPEVAVWVRPGLQIMSLWSAAIAWRRFLQGILIGFNQPRKMAWGTAVRLVSTTAVIVPLALATDWPGVYVAASGLMTGVVAEALFATWAVRPLFKKELNPATAVADLVPISYRDLFWFHMPLAGTSVLILLVQPLVVFSLARLDRPTQSLAAWPVLFQLMLMARAAALALPEAVISLSKGPHTYAPIRRFSLNLAGATTLIIALIIFTPAADFYLFIVQDMTAAVGELARSSLPYFLLYPALATLTSWLRGLLIHKRATKYVNVGMVVNLVLTAVILIAGVFWRWPGLITAAVALNLASVAELLYLWWRTEPLVGFPIFNLNHHPVPVTIKRQK